MTINYNILFKQVFSFYMFLLFLLPTLCKAQVTMPAPSPKQNIEQEFGLGKIQINYSRPSSKGRKVFGSLVPYGKLWRTGANEATLITFSTPVEIDGKKLDSGTYALYSIPNEEVWEIILNKGISNWGIEGYNENEDVLKTKIEPLKNKMNIESFTIQLADIKKETCLLQILWEKKILNIPIQVNINDALKLQITTAMQGLQKPYWEAAQFYFEYERNLSKALENINKAIELNQKAFWMYLYKANIQKEINDLKGALQSSIISMKLAKEAKNDDYIKMNQQLQKKLK